MLYFLYSGQAFLAAVVFCVAAVCINIAGLLDRSSPLRMVARVVAILSLAIAALTATPVAWWLVVPGLIAFALWAFASDTAGSLRTVAGAIAVVVGLAAFAAELSHGIARPQLDRPARVVLIGDSLSSGGFGESQVWCETLAASVGARLVNLARPGDTVAGSIEGQVPELPPVTKTDVIFLEIGGNDMLEGRPAGDFEGGLRELSGRVVADGRTVAMFELPLLPGRWRYGAAQRRVARDLGVVLVPRRILARVLLTDQNTFDGLHLTQAGHDALAASVGEWAGWIKGNETVSKVAEESRGRFRVRQCKTKAASR